ncbi:FAD-dependent oxidoreductase [Rugosimonospora acidiphila]|uniref:FAD-dependent oxidoreductase n=1 Tax=Rugosimonospora acidiphila TaxID=556531 RepID=A0ABP9S163_9ACTN
MPELHADIVIVGAGLGGVAAALAAAQGGCSVILTEETPWLGGQLTSQGVPPDEHPYIEEFGCTRGYRRLRDGIREYYRRHYPLTAHALAKPHLNPGNGQVSRLCHEPRVAAAVIDELLAPYLSSGRLRVMRGYVPVSAAVDGDRVDAVVVRDTHTGAETTLTARYVIDATELGDLLELAGVEHAAGSESADDTGEPHAVDGPARPLDQQAFSVCFAMSHHPGEDHVIDRPAEYDFWRGYRADFWPDNHLSWAEVQPETLEPFRRGLFQDPTGHGSRGPRDLWHFRRILTAAHFEPSAAIGDITLVNWPQVDYWLGPLVGVPQPEAEVNLARARQLSLSFLYWMQTEAPRLDGGVGYPGLRPRGDALGTVDGLALYPYIRESRRILAETRVVEQHVGVQARGDLVGAEIYPDSVGIGSYRIDLHPSTGGPHGPRNFIDVEAWPFQIPLGALIPQRVENLLPAGKNIGTTHITNGCYRLHPTEWNIGEVSGALAAHCLQTGRTPRQVRNKVEPLADFQRLLTDRRGVELAWPERVRTTTKYY